MSNENKKAEAPKSETPKSEVALAVREVLSEVLPAMAAMQNQQQLQAQARIKPPPASASGHCHTCRQYLGACRGKHRETVVFPHNPNYAADFPGIKLNGRVYRSNSAGHSITVPFDSNMEFQVAEWERGEDELKLGKQKQHHSGQMGPGGTAINPLGPNAFLR